MPLLSPRLILACAVALLPAAASATALRADYDISVRGLPVGTVRLAAKIAGGAFTVDASGRTSALVRIFSDATATGRASGTFDTRGLSPDRYSHDWTEDDERERAEITFDEVRVAEAVIEPPPKPRKRVPLTQEHRTGVLDPLSSLVIPAGPAGTDICDRILPLFDGTQRFDLILTPSRTEIIQPEDGLPGGPAQICSVRYRPIAGHRPGRTSVRFMETNKDMEVWLAPVGESAWAPVRIKVRTRAGMLDMQASRFLVSDDAQTR